MPSRQLPGLGLNGFWNLGEQWYDGGNENWLKLSVMTHPVAESMTAALPASPADGVVYIVPSGANANKIAVRDAGAWVYFDPLPGITAWVKDAVGVDKRRMFDGTNWIAVP